MWENGRMIERSQDDGIGVVSIDWMDGGEVVCTYSAKINSTKDKVKFKADAITFRDGFLSRQAKQDSIGEAITLYMNK